MTTEIETLKEMLTEEQRMGPHYVGLYINPETSEGYASDIFTMHLPSRMKKARALACAIKLIEEMQAKEEAAS